MPSLAPVLFFGLVFLIFQNRRAAAGWRGSFLYAALICGLFITATTELLSIFSLLGFWEILGLWLLGCLGAIFFLMRENQGRLIFLPGFSLAEIQGWHIALLAGIAIILITVAAVGLISPPTNWDSLTYHMSRVAHWIQNRSVAFYPTAILRQLHQSPFAEYTILHFQLLSGSDRFANLVQWFSLLGATIGVSLLAKKFGAGTRGQIFAAVACATIPMGILQGSSTQNDAVAAFWLVCLAYFVLLLREQRHAGYALAAGACLGLAVLTKATAYIYAFPLMAWVSLDLLKSRSAKMAAFIPLIVSVALLINAGHYARNYGLYGSPLGPGSEGENYRYSNEVFSISAVSANVIRNIALHISTPDNRINAFMETGIKKVCRKLGISLDDPRTTWPGTKFAVINPSFHEDSAGNPLHLALAVISAVLISLQNRRQKEAFFFLVCLAAAFLLFCIYLKWQPWHSRLHLPLFVLFAALSGAAIERPGWNKAAIGLAAVLLLAALPYLLANRSRPLLGEQSILAKDRTAMYFNDAPGKYKVYAGAAEFISHSACTNVGLIIGIDDWEYPFWVLFKQNGSRAVRIEHVQVTNISQAIQAEEPFRSFAPCALIAISDKPVKEVVIGDYRYAQQWNDSSISVLMPQETDSLTLTAPADRPAR